MIRLMFLVLIFQVALLSFNTNAAIIPADKYIQYDQNDDGIMDFDIVWAASWAFQFYGCEAGKSITSPENYYTTLYNGVVKCDNQLFAPGYQNDGWQFVEQIDGLDISEIYPIYNSGSFGDGVNSGYITAFEYWNTNADYVLGVNSFSSSLISNWTALSPVGINPFQTDNKYYSNVFYARKSQPVPEPSTLLIFALGILGLSFRTFRKNS